MAWTENDIPSQRGRTVLVTGANSGLGFNTSRALAAAGARVLMACRSADKASKARDQILQLVPQAELELVSLDLASLDSVKACVQAVTEQHDKLDLLINNAGIMAVPYAQTEDGFEQQIGTNHFGHFALTLGLLPLLRKSDAARVVCVSSMAHRWTPGLDFDDLDWSRRKYRRWQAYGDSKLANLYFCFELGRRLAGSDITVAAAHPGYSDTHLQYVAAERKNSSLERAVMWLGNTLFAQNAQRGALPSLYAATAVGVISGDYIGPDGFQQTRGYPRKVGSNRRSRDQAVGAQLWAVSEQRTGMKFER